MTCVVKTTATLVMSCNSSENTITHSKCSPRAAPKAVTDFDLYGHDGDRFGVTLTCDNPDDSKRFERYAALPDDRMAALKAAHDRGIATWVSLEPVLYPEQTLHLIDLTHDFVDHYGVGKLNTVGKGLTQELNDLERSIEWHKFRSDAEAKLTAYGKSYKIKAALVEATKDSNKPPVVDHPSAAVVKPNVPVTDAKVDAVDPDVAEARRIQKEAVDDPKLLFKPETLNSLHS